MQGFGLQPNLRVTPTTRANLSIKQNQHDLSPPLKELSIHLSPLLRFATKANAKSSQAEHSTADQYTVCMLPRPTPCSPHRVQFPIVLKIGEIIGVNNYKLLWFSFLKKQISQMHPPFGKAKQEKNFFTGVFFQYILKRWSFIKETNQLIICLLQNQLKSFLKIFFLSHSVAFVSSIWRRKF